MSRPKLLRSLDRSLRTAPGYRQARSRIVRRLRRSAVGRRVARGIYSDLLDSSQSAAQAATEYQKGQDRIAELCELHKVQLAEVHATAHAAARAAADATNKYQEGQARIVELRERHKVQLARTKTDVLRSQDRQRRAIPPVSAGDLVAGLYLGDRPLIVFDVRGMDEATSTATLEEIAREQVLGCAFRPMFVSDLPDASVWRLYGHLCEQVPPEQGWSGVTGYQEYLAARMESLRSDLGAGWILSVPSTGLTTGLRAFVQQCGR